MLVVVANVAATTTTGRVLSTPEWENKITKYIHKRLLGKLNGK